MLCSRILSYIMKFNFGRISTFCSRVFIETRGSLKGGAETSQQHSANPVHGRCRKELQVICIFTTKIILASYAYSILKHF